MEPSTQIFRSWAAKERRYLRLPQTAFKWLTGAILLVGIVNDSLRPWNEYFLVWMPFGLITSLYWATFFSYVKRNADILDAIANTELHIQSFRFGERRVGRGTQVYLLIKVAEETYEFDLGPWNLSRVHQKVRGGITLEKFMEVVQIQRSLVADSSIMIIR